MNVTPPAGYTTVAPWIITRDTGQLLDFIAAAFDGVEVAGCGYAGLPVPV